MAVKVRRWQQCDWPVRCADATRPGGRRAPGTGRNFYCRANGQDLAAMDVRRDPQFFRPYYAWMGAPRHRVCAALIANTDHSTLLGMTALHQGAMAGLSWALRSLVDDDDSGCPTEIVWAGMLTYAFGEASAIPEVTHVSTDRQTTGEPIDLGPWCHELFRTLRTSPRVWIPFHLPLAPHQSLMIEPFDPMLAALDDGSTVGTLDGLDTLCLDRIEAVQADRGAVPSALEAITAHGSDLTLLAEISATLTRYRPEYALPLSATLDAGTLINAPAGNVIATLQAIRDSIDVIRRAYWAGRTHLSAAAPQAEIDYDFFVLGPEGVVATPR